jgi:hypothetical protein
MRKAGQILFPQWRKESLFFGILDYILLEYKAETQHDFFSGFVL